MNLFNKRDKASANKFHEELTEITKAQDVTYVEALVQYLNEAGLGECNKETIEKYLSLRGLSETDVQLLANEYCLTGIWSDLD